MAFLKETTKSLSIYFLVVGCFGLLSNFGSYADSKHYYSPLAQAIIISDVMVCLIYMYVGKALKKLIQEKSHIPIGILAVNLAVIFVTGLINPAAFGKLIVSAFITFYLYANLKRLMKYGET